uniref:ZP domain-containing protein n=1 Tax=Panagrellus redivivus TaxID=6233 RepID=A0A7E4W5V0_PANRE
MNPSYATNWRLRYDYIVFLQLCPRRFLQFETTMTRINIFPVVLWLTILTKTTLQIAVSVSCSSNAIDLTFAFDEPFIGKIVTRPKRECSAIGKGTSRLKVTIELDAQTRNRCSIVEHENEYIGIIDVQMHRSLSLSEDTSYLVRCPKNNPNKNEHLRKPQVFGAPTAKLTVFDKNKTAHTVKAGKQYDLKLVTTNQESVNSPVEMKQCVAFTGNSELQLIQLTDNNGCPTAEGLKYGFQADDNIDLKTRIKMFDPGNSSTVYLQCKLKKCDPLCQKVSFI